MLSGQIDQHQSPSDRSDWYDRTRSNQRWDGEEGRPEWGGHAQQCKVSKSSSVKTVNPQIVDLTQNEPKTSFSLSFSGTQSRWLARLVPRCTRCPMTWWRSTPRWWWLCSPAWWGEVWKSEGLIGSDYNLLSWVRDGISVRRSVWRLIMTSHVKHISGWSAYPEI